MILDILNNFGTNLTVNTATGTNLITGYSYIPLLPPAGVLTATSMDEGMGSTLIWYVRVNTAITSGASTALQFALLADTVVPTTSSPQAILFQAAATGTLNIASGTEFKYKLPRGFLSKYLGIASINTGNVLTAGTIDSWIQNDDVQDNRISQIGYTVL